MDSVDIALNNLNENYKLNYVAKQANGSVLYQHNGTIILATIAIEKQPVKEDFLPLVVQYIEKSYAIRKIPGGFIKREGKPGEFETLTSRLIDRTLRPLFPAGYYYPTQITIFVLSYDGMSDLQVCALHAGANALLTSGLDFIPPVSSVRIARINNELIINPTLQQLRESSLDLYVSGSNEELLMIEMKGSNESEDDLLEAIKLAQSVIKNDCIEFTKNLKPFKNPTTNLELLELKTHPEIYSYIDNNYKEQVKAAINQMSKSERSDSLDLIADEILKSCIDSAWDLESIKDMLNLYKKHEVRKMILDSGLRADGRRLDEVRKIDIQTNLLPQVHGSALFTRGQTQALVVATLGGENDAQSMDSLSFNSKDRFLFHYNFPGFSVGEASMIGGVGRRELGHGNLAKKALESSIKNEKQTIRLVSEILESNGSSSMASVCGGSLALRACGLNNELVAGVAMGLVMDRDKYAVLTDIMGLEDHDGDMDFKIAGTNNAITAMQMDIKLGGLDFSILKEALFQAKLARIYILNIMENAAKNIVLNYELLPKVEVFSLPAHKMPEIIGTGGKVIKEIIEKFNVQIDLNKESSLATINGESKDNVLKAKEYILNLIAPSVTYEPGEVFKGIIKKVADFGVFVALPRGGGDGLIHISKIKKESTPLKDRFKEGEELTCVFIGDSKGKVELGLA